MCLDSVVERLRKFRDERGWRKYHTPKNLAISISVEAAELLEIFQWTDNVEDKKAQIEEEVADVMIYILYFCDVMGIDILKAIERKMEKNERKYPADVGDLW